MHGCTVIVRPVAVDEYRQGDSAAQVVEQLAIRKLETYFHTWGDSSLPILAADTLIDCRGKLLGKAHSEEQARMQLVSLSGKTHTVHSAYALYFPCRGIISGSAVANVSFSELDENVINQYLASGQWRGAAGSYRIQGEAGRFIDAIEGDYFVVVGLPIKAISDILLPPA